MSSKLKQFLKTALRRSGCDTAIKSLVVRALEQLVNEKPEILDYLSERHVRSTNERLIAGLPNIGVGVCFGGRVCITDPRGLVLGNNVHIGDNAYLMTRGGLTIGDNTHISRNVTIYTANHEYMGMALPYDHQYRDRPVVIGKNVWIGMNVSIAPGTTVGDGAVLGMGAVVHGDIPAGAIIGAGACEQIESRDMPHYDRLRELSAFGGPSGMSLPVSAVRGFHQNAAEKGAQLFFVLGTGRSGSTTIARALSRHPDVDCRHEPKLQLVRLSTEFAHGQKSADEVKAELRQLYVEASVMPPGCYGESDQKFSNMVPLLAELFPQAKFIWLLRNARDTVNSTCSRGWFSDAEMFPEDVDDLAAEPLYRGIFSQYRVRADKTGELDPAAWRSMTAFERNCWYWNRWNSQIEASLRNLPESRRLFVRLEELSAQTETIFDFLGVDRLGREVVKVENVAESRHRLMSADDWDAEKTAAFERQCAHNDTRWYDPGYRL